MEDKKLDLILTGISEMRLDIKELKPSQTEIKSELKELKENQDNILGEVERVHEIMNTETDLIKQSVNNIYGNVNGLTLQNDTIKALLKLVDNLEQRLTKLEDKIA